MTTIAENPTVEHLLDLPITDALFGEFLNVRERSALANAFRERATLRMVLAYPEEKLLWIRNFGSVGRYRLEQLRAWVVSASGETELTNRRVAALRSVFADQPNSHVRFLLAELEKASAALPPRECGDGVTVGDFQRTNAARSRRWAATGSRPWTLLEWAGELCGEVGEAANVAKKLMRLELGMAGNKAEDLDRDDLRARLGGELADVLIVASLLASAAGVDLEAALVETFNAKSVNMGFPERLGAQREGDA